MKIKIPHTVKQQGFTLIELLIGMIISLFIGGMAVMYMVSSAQILASQNSEDLSQENARFAFEIMTSTFRLGGSNISNNPEANADGIFTGAICSGADCNANSLNYSISGTTFNSDRVAVDYVTDTATTCTGSSISTEKKIVTVFYIDDADDDGIASLYCQSYEAFLDPIAKDYIDFTTPNNAVALLDGVDSLQIQYGVDIDADEDVDIYSSYNNVAASDLDNVRAIRIGLLVSSGQLIATQKSTIDVESRTYNVLEGVYTINDGVLRQSVSTTVFLPNMASS